MIWIVIYLQWSTSPRSLIDHSRSRSSRSSEMFRICTVQIQPRETCPRLCRFYGFSPVTRWWARSHRSRNLATLKDLDHQVGIDDLCPSCGRLGVRTTRQGVVHIDDTGGSMIPYSCCCALTLLADVSMVDNANFFHWLVAISTCRKDYQVTMGFTTCEEHTLSIVYLWLPYIIPGT